MSGYLARLAAGVARNRSSIHPLVAPLLASPHETAELPALEEERITSPRRRTEVPEAAKEPRRPEIVPPGASSAINGAGEPQRPEIARPGTSSALGGVAESRSEHPAAPVARTRPQAAPVSAAPDETGGLSKPAGRLRAPSRRGTDEEVPVAGSYAPLLSVDTFQNATPFAPAPATQQHTSSSRPLHGARPARELDEVTIHIGRIEVTAVAPSPASRPPLNPARKSPSLDEYLMRGRR